MKFKRRSREEPSINLTPLIDVVFLLLIFFMVTTTFTRETRLAVNLPEADGDPSDEIPEQVEIVVDQEGRYSIDGRTLVDGRLQTLISGLEQATEGDRGVPILLVADAESTHQAVVTAMDAIGQAGFSRLQIATRGEEEGEEN